MQQQWAIRLLDDRGVVILKSAKRAGEEKGRIKIRVLAQSASVVARGED